MLGGSFAATVGGSGGIDLKEEGASQGTITSLDCTGGAQVTCSESGGAGTINVTAFPAPAPNYYVAGHTYPGVGWLMDADPYRTALGDSFAKRAPHKLGGALVFDGSNDYVAVADHADLDLITEWTISAWVKLNAVGATQQVLQRYGGASGNNGYDLYITSGNVMVGRVFEGDGLSACTGTTALAASTWYHLAVTFDDAADTLVCYLNGAVDNTNPSATTSPSGDGTAAMNIGTATTPLFYLNGFID